MSGKLMKHAEHIFFDLDHTLWDFDRNSELAFQRIFKKHKIGIPLSDFMQFYKPINLTYWKMYREQRISKPALRRGRFADVFKACKYDISLRLIDALAVDYIHHLPDHNYLIPGAKDLLEYLKPKYQLHIITNGFREIQTIKLKKSGIFSYFASITNSEDAGVKKPNPSIFTHALSKAGATATNSIMIGDNYEADILGAAAMGFETIFFNYHKEKVSGTSILVSDLDSIKKHL